MPDRSLKRATSGGGVYRDLDYWDAWTDQWAELDPEEREHTDLNTYRRRRAAERRGWGSSCPVDGAGAQQHLASTEQEAA